ncbi:YbhN family protein [Actinocorallia longicatena]|uniref:YbhN family protein n=1 Tax=Actinocorallia longicatena TaxID=111803 RepID=A0ABP6PXU1_9ACTN
MRRPRRVVLGRAAMLAAVAVSLVVFADELPSPGSVWHEVAEADTRWLALVVATELLSMSSFARLQRRLLTGGGLRISLRRVFAVTYAGNAISATLPAGPAMSLAYAFRQWRGRGASRHLATAVVLVGGAATTLSYTVVTSAALLAEPGSRLPSLVTLLALAAAGLTVLLLVRGGRLAGPVARVTSHPRIGPWVAELREGLHVISLSWRGWTAVSLLACTVWLCDIIGVVAATHAVGLHLTPLQAALAYFTAQAAGSVLPILPGGLGAMEASMAAAMVGFGAAAAPAGAAVALYRLVAFWGVVALGWLAWTVLRLDGTFWARARTWLEAAGTNYAMAAGYTGYTVAPASEPRRS